MQDTEGDSPPTADQIFQALGDSSRRQIVDHLVGGPLSVSQLAHLLGLTVTAAAQHLSVLETARLVTTQKTGRVRSCSLNPAGFSALEQWVRGHRTAWEKKLDRLAQFLENSG
jgi:DNA-binding transcriptional ArsR family regulator